MKDPQSTSYYYVDEAGDLTLFSRTGKVLVGTEGCSSFFMLGVAHLPDPASAESTLAALRDRLLRDPYFSGVPSMQPDRRKTARFFHAKDDLPEVRREVFAILPSLGAKVQVAIRRKHSLADEAKVLFAKGKRLTPDAVYDDLVKRLFKNLLHKADRNEIAFAWRGKSSRSEALSTAIQHA